MNEGGDSQYHYSSVLECEVVVKKEEELCSAKEFMSNFEVGRCLGA